MAILMPKTFRDESADISLEDDMLPPSDNDPKGDFAYRAELESTVEILKRKNFLLRKKIIDLNTELNILKKGRVSRETK